MSIRDRIAVVLRGHRLGSETFTAGDGHLSVAMRSDDEIAERVAEILADELYPTITTAEQLDALPVGSVVNPSAVVMVPPYFIGKHIDGWFGRNNHLPVPPHKMLPAQLIWSPEWIQGNEGDSDD